MRRENAASRGKQPPRTVTTNMLIQSSSKRLSIAIPEEGGAANVTDDTQAIYIAFIEVQPLEGCKVDPEVSAGAFTVAFIPAPSFFSALNSLLMSLKKEKLQLLDLEYLALSTAFDWPEATLELIQEAHEAQTVIYDTFNSYPHEEVQD